MRNLVTKSKTAWIIILGMVSFTANVMESNAQVHTPGAPTLQPRQYDVVNSYWQEVNFIGKITKNNRFQYQLDWQYRRQSDQYGFNGTNANTSDIFLHPYQNVFRPWIHYFTGDRKVRLSISPIGYWATFGESNKGYGESGTANNGVNAPKGSTGLREYPEIRSCYQVTTYDKIGRVSLAYRGRFEFRWVGTTAPSTAVNTESGWDIWNMGPMINSISKFRLRLFARADIPLQGQTLEHKEFYFAAQDELWIGMGKGTNDNGFLDQNRVYAAFGYKIGKEIRIELGYLNQIVANGSPLTSTSPVGVNGSKPMTWNNTLHFFIFFDNFNSFFQKKSTKEENQARKKNAFENVGSF
jgi:hypothetical protein